MLAQIRRILRRDIPKPIRLRIASWRRYLADRFSGHAPLMVGRTEIPRDLTGWVEVLSIAQVIRPAELREGKLHNLRLATGRLNGVVIDPGRIFSFWALAGLPDAINGYQAGRSIREDVLGAEIGGGLCQLSGLVYELGLRAEMEVVERHPHSLDLYTEATRFTLLGLDATVVWGYKDLRLRNASARSVAFAFELRADQIIGALLSRQRSGQRSWKSRGPDLQAPFRSSHAIGISGRLGNRQLRHVQDPRAQVVSRSFRSRDMMGCRPGSGRRVDGKGVNGTSNVGRA